MKKIPVKYYCENCKHYTIKTVSLMQKGLKVYIGCENCGGLAALATSDKEQVELERAARCRDDNMLPGKHMRFCESCEVPLGIYLRLPVKTCNHCGGRTKNAGYF